MEYYKLQVWINWYGHCWRSLCAMESEYIDFINFIEEIQSEAKKGLKYLNDFIFQHNLLIICSTALYSSRLDELWETL